MPYIMQCAWCGTILGTRDIPGADEELISVTHTICPPCYAAAINEIRNADDKACPGPQPALSLFRPSELPEK